jgi:hypothetical protein
MFAFHFDASFLANPGKTLLRNQHQDPGHDNQGPADRGQIRKIKGPPPGIDITG